MRKRIDDEIKTSIKAFIAILYLSAVVVAVVIMRFSTPTYHHNRQVSYEYK